MSCKGKEAPFTFTLPHMDRKRIEWTEAEVSQVLSQCICVLFYSSEDRKKLPNKIKSQFINERDGESFYLSSCKEAAQGCTPTTTVVSSGISELSVHTNIICAHTSAAKQKTRHYYAHPARTWPPAPDACMYTQCALYIKHVRFCICKEC